MNLKPVLHLIEEKFIARLKGKTGWGKNEVLLVYKESVAEAVSEWVLDHMDEGVREESK